MAETHKNRYVDAAVLLLLCLLGSLLYSRTLQIPWLFDDIQNIVENPVVRSVPSAISNLFGQRGVAYLTFALNYHFGGTAVAGYHIVNIAIHLLASWVVYLLAKRAFPTGSSAELSPFTVHNSHFSAFAVALIFLVHPVQTQAVNYIVQRMTSLSALFFLTALYGYCRFREAGTAPGGSAPPALRFAPQAWYIFSLAAAALALMTKQNAAVLAAALFLFDWLILSEGRLPRPLGRRLLSLVPFVLLACLFIYLQVGRDDVLLKDAGRAEYWSRAGEASATSRIAPAQSAPVPDPQAAAVPQVKIMDKPPRNLQGIYLVTEFSVLWLYQRLLLLPYGQVFDYGYPLEGKLLTLQNVAAGGGLILLIVLAFAIHRRQRYVSFGIFWFFVALAVESTIIPLDAAVEHRLYLPMFGFAIALVGAIRSLPWQRLAAGLLCLALAGYTGAAWQRNALWADPIAFALDGVSKAPGNQRNHITLANAYAEAGRWSEAEAALRKAIPLRPFNHIPYDNLGSALFKQGKLTEARRYFGFVMLLKPGYPNAVYNYGVVSIRMGDMTAAARALHRLRELGSPLAMQLGSQFMNQ
jgi:hypothetical protein